MRPQIAIVPCSVFTISTITFRPSMLLLHMIHGSVGDFSPKSTFSAELPFSNRILLYKCYCAHERPCHAPPGKPQPRNVSHTAHTLGPHKPPSICDRSYGVGCESPSHVIVDELWFVTIPHTLHKSVSWYMLSSLCSSSQDSDSACISQASQSIQQELYPCPFIHVPQQHAPVCVPIS